MISLPNTLSFRLSLLYACTFTVILLSALLILYISLSHTLNEEIKEDLLEDIEEFRLLLSNEGPEAVFEEIQKEILTENPEEFFIQLLDVRGKPLRTSNLKYWSGLSVNREALNEAGQGKDVLITVELDGRDSPDLVAYGKISPKYFLMLAESTSEKDEVMEIVFFVFTILIILVSPMTAISGWLITKRSLQPLNEISRAALDIEHGQLERKVNIKNQKIEIQSLADQFNSMAHKIRTLITEMREMIDNIAHDLRSPIGRIRAISEDSLTSTKTADQYRNAASDSIEECDRLIKLINTTLDVAEAEAQVNQTIREKINLSSLVEGIYDLYSPVAEEMNIEFTSQIESQCEIQGIYTNLQRMISNLIDNAFKYTSSPGHVRVKLEKNDKYLDIKISDDGIGVQSKDQPRIFERFFRSDNSRSKDGCGLGLSYARAVARAHGGDISLESQHQEGSIFTITLPFSPAH